MKRCTTHNYSRQITVKSERALIGSSGPSHSVFIYSVCKLNTLGTYSYLVSTCRFVIPAIGFLSTWYRLSARPRLPCEFRRSTTTGFASVEVWWEGDGHQTVTGGAHIRLTRRMLQAPSYVRLSSKNPKMSRFEKIKAICGIAFYRKRVSINT